MRRKSLRKKGVKAKMDKQSLIIIASIGLVILGVVCYNFYMSLHPATWVSPTEQLPANKVCMVNNTYMGVQQIEVPIEDNIYYGCCETCVTTLNQKPESRYAIDPYSGERVDKSIAYIYLNPDSKYGGVLYFKSQENAQKYIEN
ncbi:MAG: hypothetical protein RLO17_24635 [Cyclobacteriaceae bacterium]|jgi:YHS domain-containing protein|tara:strand:- start:27225 stop:27656 length:432 start_codon:yes stop_codon:yes gene_type:complete